MRRREPIIEITVKNTSTKPIPISVGQHFAECDPALCFDRRRVYGYRLYLPGVDSDYVFPPLSVSVVKLGVADPNFFSKTMMVPIEAHWKDLVSSLPPPSSSCA